MKKLFLLLFALPSLAMAQTKNVITVERVYPKQDKVQEYEKALASHVQKYHKGDWAWRVYTIETGPEAGGYHIVEGPMSWEGLDNRGNLGEAHQSDYNKGVSPFTNADKGSSMYVTYRPDLSTVQLTDYSNKIAITHIFPKPGYTDDMEDAIKKLKKAWEAGGQSVAVYEASSSGPQQYTFVYRYKQGLKERETGFRKPMKDRYNMANGDGSWNAYTQSVRNMIDHSWSEVLFFHPELSSK
ncbi:MAG: hypothetical protein M3004_05240 [Bacteroidota bacterium]|nr:hypothetical protein [Bacteroidota bacterium]